MNAASRELGPLGLPNEFSSDPSEQRAQLEEALEVGYKTLNRVYGALGATGWMKNVDSVIVAATTAEFTDLVCRDDPENQQSLRDGFAKNTPLAWTTYTTQRVFIDASSLEYPLQAAEIMAHEAIHAKAGKNAIRFRHITAAQMEGRQDILESFEDRANEGLVDHSAMEALGLLTHPITNLKRIDLIMRARNALVVKELARGLGGDTSFKIFRITQGTFRPDEADWIDRKIGPSPLSRIRTSYFEHGFLFTIGGLNTMRDRNPFQPGELEDNVMQTAVWFTNSRRRTNISMEFMSRDDFKGAEALIRRDRILRGE